MHELQNSSGRPRRPFLRTAVQASKGQQVIGQVGHMVHFSFNGSQEEVLCPKVEDHAEQHQGHA
ncbi:MAG: hypothetical protein ACJ797_08770 [Ktedonobacteraceae bacterium]